jgi:hypothetical protein
MGAGKRWVGDQRGLICTTVWLERRDLGIEGAFTVVEASDGTVEGM